MDRDRMIRGFVAVELPAEVRGFLADLVDRVRSRGIRARWVHPDRMHITLRFLGEIPAPRFEAVRAALARPIAAGGHPELVPAGIGTFPPRGRARVLWAGLRGDTAVLGRCALEVEGRLEALGFPREPRPFRPHITLARARSPGGIAGLDRIGPEIRAAQGPGFRVTHLTLFESRLRPQGPEYIPRAVVPLDPGS